MKTFAPIVAGLAATLFAVVVAPVTAEQTWTGAISDSACGAKHVEAAEGQGKMPDRECTEACIRGGSLYVFVPGDKVGKVYQIANQKNEDVIAHAGHRVKLTGELKDETITVSKIEMTDQP
jgi:hypothetical protein